MSLLTCDQFLDELSEYLDESAKGQVRGELQEHIDECPNCWVMVDTTQKTLKIYRGMEPEPLPEGLRHRLMSALEKKMAGQPGI
jgi:anti-sigma factor (TIGR02949 family)